MIVLMGEEFKKRGPILDDPSRSAPVLSTPFPRGREVG